MDLRLLSPRLPRMYRVLEPACFNSIEFVSVKIEFRYGLFFNAVLKRALEKSLAFFEVGRT